MPRAHSISSSESAIRNLKEWIEQDKHALAKWPGDERLKGAIADNLARIEFHKQNIEAIRAKNKKRDRTPSPETRLRQYNKKLDAIEAQISRKTRAREYAQNMLHYNPAYYDAQITTLNLDLRVLESRRDELKREYGQ